jgi:acyl carrier protein
MSDELEQARSLLANAMGADVSTVPLEARIGQFERWDSLVHVRLLLSVEQRIGRLLEPDEAVRIECVGDIAELLNAQGAKR